MYFKATVRFFAARLYPLYCLTVLTVRREMKNQRDELAQSSAVDANALTEKLEYA